MCLTCNTPHVDFPLKFTFFLTSYKGPLLDDGALLQAVSAGAASPEFTKLCAWLVSELRVLCKLEENVKTVIISQGKKC